MPMLAQRGQGASAMHSRQSSAGVGWSRLPESAKAGKEAVRMALDAAKRSDPVVVIVYMTVLYDPHVVLAAIREQIGPNVPIVGSSTQGISQTGAVTETGRVLGVAVICSERVRAVTAHAQGLCADPGAAGRKLAEQLGDPRQLGEVPLLLWFDPLTGANVQALIDGLAAGGYTSVIGGASGQPWGPFDKTYQYFDTIAMNDGVVALKLEGLKGAVWDTSHGVEPLGLEVCVTEAEGNVIRSLDHKPALDVWSEQLLGTFTFHVDDWAWVLGVRIPGSNPNDPEGLVSRGVFGINEQTKELSLLAPIPVGSTVQICHRTVEAVFDRALLMGERIRERLLGRSPLLALAFECGARPRPFLGDEKTLEENCRIQETIGVSIPWLGMFPWGEIAPRGNCSHFSNFQFPLLVLCD
jgi:hypothetical protein